MERVKEPVGTAGKLKPPSEVVRVVRMVRVLRSAEGARVTRAWAMEAPSVSVMKPERLAVEGGVGAVAGAGGWAKLRGTRATRESSSTEVRRAWAAMFTGTILVGRWMDAERGAKVLRRRGW